MSQLLQAFLSVLIGVAMAIYGIVHAVTQFPSPVAFASLADNMPAVIAVLLFLLGLVAFIAGIVITILGARNLRRRWYRFNQIARHAGVQQYDDDGWGPAYR